MVMAVFMTAMSYAQVDTVKFIPGKEGVYELKVDTVKYPYLAGKEVSWFAGFPEVTTTFNPTSKPEIKTVCATPISKDQITTIKGHSFLHLDAVPTDWFAQATFEGAPHPRTITIFYVHKIVTKSVEDEYGNWYERSDFDSFTCDTVGVLHILKELNSFSIANIEINGSVAENTFKVQEGDTVKVKFNLNKDHADSLDVQMYGISDGEKLITHSIFNTLEFVPEESYTSLIPVISNNMGDYEVNSREFNVTVYPKFKVEGVTYTKSQNGITNIVESPDSLSAQVIATKGDSVQLVINTNIEEASLFDGKVPTYNWNKDGKNLSEGIINNGDTLIIPNYNKEYSGVYNCLVAYDNKVTTVTFNLSYDSPTANEQLNLSDAFVASSNGSIVCNNVSQKEVKVINYLGSVVYNKISTSSRLEVKVNPGIYIVSIEGVIYKIRVK